MTWLHVWPPSVALREKAAEREDDHEGPVHDADARDARRPAMLVSSALTMARPIVSCNVLLWLAGCGSSSVVVVADSAIDSKKNRVERRR
jgi:hypothetical protein